MLNPLKRALLFVALVAVPCAPAGCSGTKTPADLALAAGQTNRGSNSDPGLSEPDPAQTVADHDRDGDLGTSPPYGKARTSTRSIGSGRRSAVKAESTLEPAQVLAPFLQESLHLTGQQNEQLEELQKEAESELGKILTDEQKRQLKEMQEGLSQNHPVDPGPRSPGSRGGSPGSFPIQDLDGIPIDDLDDPGQ